MKIKSVDIENFLSIEKAHVEFDDAGLLLIEGYNYDVDRSNGAGKTAILNAISFCLYDKLPRKITASEILRRGAGTGCVTVHVDCGEDILVVVRRRPKGVMFYRQTDDETHIPQILTQAEFEKKLGLTYSQFIVTMYCSQASTSSSPRFLTLNDADKKQFLLQLLDLDEFSLCKKKVDENIAGLTTEMGSVQNHISNLQARVDAFSESLIDEDQTRLELSEKQVEYDRLKAELNNLKCVAQPDLAKFQRLEDDIAARKIGFAKTRASRDMLASQLTILSKKIRPFNADDICPACGATLDNSHAKKIHDQEMAKLAVEQVELKNKIAGLDSILSGESKIDDLSLKVKLKKKQESTAFEQANTSKTELSTQIATIGSIIGNLSKKFNDNVIVVQKIEALRQKQEIFRSQLNTLASELEVQKTIAGIYSPTGAQAYVLDSAVAMFNEHMAKHVEKLWPNLTYELKSYKETVRGDVTAKFSESIVMDGRTISLGSLSGGEFRALSLCADMALLEMLEQQYGIHTSPVIFDEAFDGLDAAGKEYALDLIRDLAQDRQVVVIDHASEMRTAFDKVIRVEKRNGISTVNVQS